MEILSQRFWERLDGAISLGANYTRSSGIGQGTLNANVTSRRERNEWPTKLGTTVTIQNEEPQSTRTASPACATGPTRLRETPSTKQP